MLWFDIFRMAINNLYRRKSRTLLTVSGVIIGSCSIIIMISLGIGMKAAQEKMLSELGSLRRITVSSPTPNEASKLILDQNTIKKIQMIPGVKTAIPKKTLNLGSLVLTTGDQNRYECSWSNITGIPDSDFEKIGYVLKKGKYPEGSYQILCGENFPFQFSDTRRPEGRNTVDYWEEDNPKPYFEPIGADIFITSKKEIDNTLATEKVYGKAEYKEIQKLRISGLVKEDYQLGDETSGLIMRIKDLERLSKTINKLNSEKSEKGYSQILVDVEKISDVESVEKQIADMGYQTYSMESIRKPMEKEAQQKQLLLGGLGAISLLVAAIGIANTMIMSIGERTKEIGIMKAMGCNLNDIKKEFLMEAAFIGLFGGILGVIGSNILSVIMNQVASTESSNTISIIPLWLMGFAIIFSIFIGIAAGYYPAGKAVKIPALEAMKS